MNKLIKNFLLFTLFASVLYVFLVFVWALSMPKHLKPNVKYLIGSYGHMYTRMEEVKETHDIDVLFLGSSHTYRGFDPRIFSKNGFSSLT